MRRVWHVSIKEQKMDTSIQKVSDYMRSERVWSSFAEVVGSHNAGAYISSVLLSVASSTKLQECASASIYISALRAATLRLSVDPSTGQAYLVPFGGKATLIVGYKGLYDMAVRTGRYRYINVTPIYEGETIQPDRISGLVTPTSLGGSKKSDKVIGWLGAFEMNPERGQSLGYTHTLYMTVEEIHAHAQKYSKSYSYKDSGWQTDPAAMERKTVLRLLLRKWGYLDPSDIQALESIEAEPEAIDVEAMVDNGHNGHHKSEGELMADLGYGEKPQVGRDDGEERPYTPEALRSRIADRATYHKVKKTPANKNLAQVMAINLDECFAGDERHEDMRHAVVFYLCGRESLKDIETCYLLALKDWLNPTQDNGGAWQVEAVAATEARAVFTAAIAASGNMTLPGLEEK